MMGREEDKAITPGDGFAAQVEKLRRAAPSLHDKLDQARVASWRAELEASPPLDHDDFGSEESGGRGESYLRAQISNSQARSTGITHLLSLIRRNPAGFTTIVDLLGGDGLVHRVCAENGVPDLEIMTCDASPHMIRAAWSMGIPALLQRAERQLFESESLDGVLLAYGTHHIPPDLRSKAVAESFRVLSAAGTFVMHDFEVGSVVDTWFTTIVDHYSRTGHRYRHFTTDEIHEYMLKAGFAECELLEIHDPYVGIGVTPRAAERAVGEYLVNMYGLSNACDALGEEEAAHWAVREARQIFQYPDGLQTTVQQLADDRWMMTIPRIAIVGVGRKL